MRCRKRTPENLTLESWATGGSPAHTGRCQWRGKAYSSSRHNFCVCICGACQCHEDGPFWQDLHIVKDAVFCFKGDVDNPSKSGCDWHVDDAFFWPAANDANGPGVNVWLALDPVTADGGGLCVAAQSHTEEFLDCRKAISTGPQDTCSMSTQYPQVTSDKYDIT